MASHDLNATLLAWPPRHEVVEHINAELDVLVIVLDGDGSAIVDGETHDLAAGTAILISVHRRRGPLQIQTTADR